MSDYHSIDLSSRKDLVIIKNDADELSEEDIKKMFKQIEKENKRIKEKYFSVNTPITNIEQRTFKDLLKIFIKEVKTHAFGNVIRS